MTKETSFQLSDAETIKKNAPAAEPERQYYFIQKVREILRARFEADVASGEAFKRYGQEQLDRLLESGSFGTFCITTFGCQMNARDSEKLQGILEECGFLEAPSEDADFVLYNTCTVRENANLKVYGRLGYLNSQKKKHPSMMIALCGCMMQEEQVVEKIRKSYRFVDVIFGTHNIFKLAELIFDRLSKKGMVVDVWKGTDQIVEDLPTDRKYPFKSGVNIMFGCNNFCSYCIVPYVRGRERSREPEEIIKEIESLVADGVIEVMLLGQNVNSYGKTLETPITFAGLLRRVEKIEGLRRIRFMTSHPKDLSDELIEVMRDSKKICRHLHLPLQSGSSRILKEMNRRYTKEQYLSLVDKIKTAIPDISLTTDIIVGFPRGDRRGLRGDHGRGEKGAVRQRVHFHLFQTDRDAGGVHGEPGSGGRGEAALRPASGGGAGHLRRGVRQGHGHGAGGPGGGSKRPRRRVSHRASGQQHRRAFRGRPGASRNTRGCAPG